MWYSSLCNEPDAVEAPVRRLQCPQSCELNSMLLKETLFVAVDRKLADIDG